MTFAFPPGVAALNNYDPAQIQRRVDAVASPTFVGNTIALTVPGHEIWHPLIVRYDVTASANVGSRFPRLTYKFQNSVTLPIPNGQSLAASLSLHMVNVTNCFTQASEIVGATTTFVTYMPDVFLAPGDQLQLVVNQILAGDSCTLFQVVNDVMFTEPGAPPRPGIYDTDRVAEIEHVLEQATMPGLR